MFGRFSSGDGIGGTDFVARTSTQTSSDALPDNGGAPADIFQFAQYGNWQQVAQSATGGGISGNGGIHIPLSGRQRDHGAVRSGMAENVNGYEGVYVREWDPSTGTWSLLAGSGQNGDISDNVSDSSNPSIAVNPVNGHYAVAYQDNVDGDYDIYVKEWNPQTQTWTMLAGGGALGDISNTATESTNPSIVYNSTTGRWAVAWQEDVNGNEEIYVREWDGKSWNELDGGGITSATGGGVSNNATASTSPVIVYNSANQSYLVAWQDVDPVLGHGGAVIYAREWTGAGWQELAGSATGVGISGGSGTSTSPTAVYNPDTGGYAIAWQDIDPIGRDSDIYVKEWDGTAWNELAGSASDGGISKDAGASVSPRITYNSDLGRYFVAWTGVDAANGDSEVYGLEWDGQSWLQKSGLAAAGGISNSIGNSTAAAVVYNAGAGGYFVAWQNDSSGNDKIYAREWHTKVSTATALQSQSNLDDIYTYGTVDDTYLIPQGVAASGDSVKASFSLQQGVSFPQVNLHLFSIDDATWGAGSERITDESWTTGGDAGGDAVQALGDTLEMTAPYTGAYQLVVEQTFGADNPYAVTLQVTPGNGTLPAPHGQVIFLNFGGENVTFQGPFDAFDVKALGFAGQRQQMINSIVADVRAVYAGFDVQIVTTRPAGSGYQEIVIGQSPTSDFGVFGLSEDIDFQDQRSNDQSLIFADRFKLFADYAGATQAEVAQALANAIAHEADHLMGAVHVGGSSLMNYGTLIDEMTQEHLATGDLSTFYPGAEDPWGGYQDDNRLLAWFAGLGDVGGTVTTAYDLGLVGTGSNVTQEGVVGDNNTLVFNENDVDMYSFKLATSARVTFGLSAMTAGNSDLDGLLRVFRSNGYGYIEQVASNDNADAATPVNLDTQLGPNLGGTYSAMLSDSIGKSADDVDGYSLTLAKGDVLVAQTEAAEIAGDSLHRADGVRFDGPDRGAERRRDIEHRQLPPVSSARRRHVHHLCLERRQHESCRSAGRRRQDHGRLQSATRYFDGRLLRVLHGYVAALRTERYPRHCDDSRRPLHPVLSTDGKSMHGIISQAIGPLNADDVDFYRVTLTAGELCRRTSCPPRAASPPS